MSLDLRQERIRRGLSLDDIAASTRIPVIYLEALESGDDAVLPPGPFRDRARERYLAELGFEDGTLDEDGALDARAPAEDTTTTLTIPRAEEVPVVRLVVGGFLGTLAILFALRLGGTLLDRAPAEPPAPATEQVHIRTVAPTRLRLVVDGEVRHDGPIDARQTLEFTAEHRVEVDAADPSALVIRYNGERVEPLHEVTRPRRLVFIQDPAE